MSQAVEVRAQPSVEHGANDGPGSTGKVRQTVETLKIPPMMQRMLAAWVKRVAAGDPEDFAELVRFGEEVQQGIQDAIDTARSGDAPAWTWTNVGRLCGITMQAAEKRWGKRSRTRGRR